MTKLQINDPVPEFLIQNSHNETISIFNINQPIILYFYPKDDTPGCTKEALGFSCLHEEFVQNGFVIIGVSKDNPSSHHKFINKYNLPFYLYSDQNSDICEKFGVWVEKSMYGRKYMGIDRVTFLIGKDKKIKHIWDKVKPNEHPSEVLEFIKNSYRESIG